MFEIERRRAKPCTLIPYLGTCLISPGSGILDLPADLLSCSNTYLGHLFWQVPPIVISIFFYTLSKFQDTLLLTMIAMDTDAIAPIAITGLSVKFPQDATSPEHFWDMLVEGRSAATRVPEDRFNVDAFYHPDPERLDAVRQIPLGLFLFPFWVVQPISLR